ncbi:MAG: DUF1738 domain-containing protein [Saprospiraceae bacterium]|nr:DUF1738 domain-containing protein [Candidatus Vicinibacter affinis]
MKRVYSRGEEVQFVSKANIDLYQEVTNKIISMLDSGVAPWRSPWNSYGLARNYVSGHIYRGINYILMNFSGHIIPYFLSFKQIKELGAVLKSGAKAEKVVYFNLVYKNLEGHRLSEMEAQALIKDKVKIDVSRFIKYYPVFNIEYVEGISVEIQDFELSPNEKIKSCEDLVENMPNRPAIKFIDSDHAYYLPSKDFINMPMLAQFQSSFAYYASLFHELAHSTGHRSRLNREGIVNSETFGSVVYSTDELIAELGSSYLSSIAQIDNDTLRQRSASDLNDWLRVLKEDNRFIFKVASQAHKAVDYILGNENQNLLAK